MAIKNYYNGKNASGTVLTDLVGGHNGTLEGAVLPTINPNGYLTFVGGNGATAGDYNRVAFTVSDWEYTYNSIFSISVKFRSNKEDAVIHDIFSVADSTISVFNFPCISFYINMDEIGTCRLCDMPDDPPGHKKNASCDLIANNTWNNLIIIYNGINLFVFSNGNPKALNFDETFVFPLYNPGFSKANLGVGWQVGSSLYIYDLTGDISELVNYNHALSNAEAKNISVYFKGMF